MTRPLLVRLRAGHLPSALLDSLRDEVVLGGWVRASGVLSDVVLRTLGGTTRRYAGPLHAVNVQGSVGMMNGDVSVGLHAVLARETESGLETLAGEIVEARVMALEVFIEAMDDITATRSGDASGLVMLDPVAPAPAGSAPAVAPQPVAPPPPPAPVAAPAAPAPVAAPEEPAKPRPSPTFMSAQIPQRIQKPQTEETEQLYPDAGDLVEHFAFGQCTVVKSDGDRLHVRLGKDGRIKEISLDMLKVEQLPSEPGAPRHFKLARKL